MMVSEIGDGVTELAGHLVEVDLQDNLFYRWDEIIQLASHLPALTNLLLQGNKIGNLTHEILANHPLARYAYLSLEVILTEQVCNH